MAKKSNCEYTKQNFDELVKQGKGYVSNLQEENPEFFKNKVMKNLSYVERVGEKRETKLDDGLKNSDFSSIQKRTKLYETYLTQYFNNYNKKTKHQTIMKWIFFGVTIFLMAFLVGVTAFSIFNLSRQQKISFEDVSLVVTSMAGVITAFIVLPNTIATNLFPSTDEDKSSEIFKSILENDYNLRNLYYKQEFEDKNKK